ncbi:MAG: penicillin-binding transpeptidase domain-containing protein [Clostridia bacterium]|nr:penicillin-binding transpeptidase domain-containing protein [Clostridia bacterium]
MKNKKNISILIAVVAILIIAIVVAIVCSVLSNKKSKETALNNPEDVINTYMSCISDGDYDNAYELLTPESKSKISKEDFSEEYKEIYDELGISSLEVTNIKTDKIDSNNSKSSYTTKVNSRFGELNFDNAVSTKKQEDNKYYVDWNYGVVYPELSENDKIEVKKTYAKRGSIIDRNGVLLAGGGYVASIGLVPGWMDEETKNTDIIRVAELLGTTEESINKKLSASYVKPDTFVEIATISKQNQMTIYSLNQIQGVKIKDVASRVYPLAEKAAHLTGYVQKASAEDIENNANYDESSLVGKTGLEKVYEDRLKGKDGYEVYIVNENGDNKKTIIKTEKEDGENIKLTIDSNIQEQVYTLYASDNSATVVMNSETGEVLALVSTPSYDPNKFVIGMSKTEWNELSNNTNNPLYARFLKSYAPGSSFKPITGAIALQTKAIKGTDEFEASGTSWQKDNSWGDYSVTTLKEYSGPANLLNALINSDNIFFAKTALKIGADKFEEQLKNIGFESDIDFVMGCSKSQISNNGKFSSEVQLADSGYGQGQILVNPVHFASIYSCFANGGNMVKPYLEYNKEGKVEYIKENAFSSEVVEEIKNDLVQTIEDAEGTAHSAKIDGVTLAGKTGTAETKSAKGENAKEFGWFNCFVVKSSSDEKLLVVSMVEGVEDKGGSSYVVEKVKNLFKANF